MKSDTKTDCKHTNGAEVWDYIQWI